MKRIPELSWDYGVRLTRSRAAFVVSRSVFGGFTFVTAFYCLLFYIPFSRHTLFGWTVVPALTLFARYHAAVYWLAAVPLCLTVIPYLKERALRRATMGFIVAISLVGVTLLFWPLLPNLPPDERSLVWSLVSLFPLWWVAALDWRSRDAFSSPSSALVQRINFRSVAAMAACVSTIYLSIFAIRYVVGAQPSFSRSQLLLIVLGSFGSHLLLFWLIFSTFKFADGITERFSKSGKLAVIVRSALVALALALILRKVVFVAVSFNGRVADLAAIILASSFVAFASTSLLRFGSVSSPVQGSPFTIALRTFFQAARVRWISLGLGVVAIAILAHATLVNLQGVDWQGLLQSLSVLVVWAATFIVFRSARQPMPAKRYSLAALVLILIAGPGLYVAIQLGRPTIARVLRQRAGPIALVFEQYADYDPAFNVAGAILAPATVDVFEGSGEDQFFAMLRQNTNLPPEVSVEAVEFNLVDHLKATSDKKPHIFIFVIDSLRQDYLSPYNSTVHFTPAIDSFARDSVVMRNAFTRYGGTALAEPSIWSGGMQAHKQFVQPFYPMNSLQKLLDGEHYRSFVTIDPVLKAILRPSAEMVELDRGVDWKDYDLVGTLSELQSKLASDQLHRPVFAFSQAQNLHLVSLKRNTRDYQTAHYRGFEPQHASEVERIDEAFGDFVRFLKSRGLYDESVIVLTADHGDSLGEDGHWGHGNSIYPEVIRIPLIIHLPERLKGTLAYDPTSVAFSTDITPTLYYLLGHRPIRNDAMFGRPLFTATMQEQQAYLRESYLIVDSYGPVYGLLRDNGGTLFVADGVRNRAYIYDLTRGYGGKRMAITDEVAGEYKKEIAREVEQIRVFYNFQTPQQTVTANSQASTLKQLYSLLFSK